MRIEAALPAALLDGLRRRYAEPWRHYHTAVHIESLLAGLDEHRALARRPDEITAAIWYHDAINDPRRSDNEARSADLAQQELAASGFDSAFIARVAELVLATRSHQADAADTDKALLLDLDLGILAAGPAAYADYAAQVRREYAHVPDAPFRAGRARVLASFLQRPRLFITPSLRARWEPSARSNLQQELESLAQSNS